MKQICAGKYFGAVVCDVLKEHFAEMPIVKNVEVTIEDVGPYMKNLGQDLDEFKTPRRSLISSYFGQVMVASHLLRWYYTHGLVVDNITAFVRYEQMACFQKFTEEVVATQRTANSDKA